MPTPATSTTTTTKTTTTTTATTPPPPPTTTTTPTPSQIPLPYVDSKKNKDAPLPYIPTPYKTDLEEINDNRSAPITPTPYKTILEDEDEYTYDDSILENGKSIKPQLYNNVQLTNTSLAAIFTSVVKLHSELADLTQL